MENGLHQTCRGTRFNAELSRHQTRRYDDCCALLHLGEIHTPLQRARVRCLQNGWGQRELPDADV